MVSGILINQSGNVENINYEEEDFVNRFDRFIFNRGVGDLICFDDIELNGISILFYGYELGYNNFNMFEFPHINVYGDAIIIGLDENQEFVDIDAATLDEYLRVDDLDDFIIEDGLDLGENEYDYNDPFIAPEESDSDYLDYIDYP